MSKKRTEDDLRAAVVRKCTPGRLKTSPELTATLGFFVGETWVKPEIVLLHEDSGGRLAAQAKGDLFPGRDMGRTETLIVNIKNVARACGLTSAERRWLLRQADTKVTR